MRNLLIPLHLMNVVLTTGHWPSTRILLQAHPSNDTIDHNIRCKFQAFAENLSRLELPAKESCQNHLFDLEDINVGEGIIIELAPPIDHTRILYRYTIHVTDCGDIPMHSEQLKETEEGYDAWPSSLSFNVDYTGDFRYPRESSIDAFQHQFLFQLLPHKHGGPTVSLPFEVTSQNILEAPYRIWFTDSFLALISVFAFCKLVYDNKRCVMAIFGDFLCSEKVVHKSTILSKQKQDDAPSQAVRLDSLSMDSATCILWPIQDFTDDDRPCGELSPTQFSCDTLSCCDDDDGSLSTIDIQTNMSRNASSQEIAFCTQPCPASPTSSKNTLSAHPRDRVTVLELEELLSYIPDSGCCDLPTGDDGLDWLASVMERVVLSEECAERPRQMPIAAPSPLCKAVVSKIEAVDSAPTKPSLPLSPSEWKSAEDIPKRNRRPFTKLDRRRLQPPPLFPDILPTREEYYSCADKGITCNRCLDFVDTDDDDCESGSDSTNNWLF